MSRLIFKDPPPAATHSATAIRYDPIMEELAQHPGKWAIVAQGVNSGVSAYLKKKYGVEATTRRNNNKGTLVDVYARFPEPSAPAPVQTKSDQAVTTVNGSEEFFTIRQLASFLETSATEIHKMNYTGKGPKFYRVANEIRYRPASVGEWLATNAYQVAGGPR